MSDLDFGFSEMAEDSLGESVGSTVASLVSAAYKFVDGKMDRIYMLLSAEESYVFYKFGEKFYNLSELDDTGLFSFSFDEGQVKQLEERLVERFESFSKVFGRYEYSSPETLWVVFDRKNDMFDYDLGYFVGEQVTDDLTTYVRETGGEWLKMQRAPLQSSLFVSTGSMF